MYETDEIRNIKTAVHNLADNGNSNQLIIGDLNSSLNRYLDYMEYLQDPHQASREFIFASRMKMSLLTSIDSYTPMI